MTSGIALKNLKKVYLAQQRQFYNLLTNREISDKDYAFNVWKTSRTKTTKIIMNLT